MLAIALKPLLHRGTVQVGLFYKHSLAVNNIVRSIKGIKWSQTHKCWYLPLNKESIAIIKEQLKTVARLDAAELKTYLGKQKKIAATLSTEKAIDKPKAITTPAALTAAWKLSNENLEALKRFVDTLKLKAYSPSTIKTYRNEFCQLLQLLKHRHVNDLNAEDLRRYFLYCFEKLKLSENTLHSRINAIKFYFEQVLMREKFFWEIPRPKKPQLLPKLLNEDEIANLFRALKNKKHKAMLFTAYSAGLRVSEVAALKLKHIDSSRMQIFIEQAKGKKDRYVPLSPVLLDILRSYLRNYKPRPKEFLFESEQSGGAFPPRTIQRIFQLAKTASGIKKDVGIHVLRHSFATHLLGKGHRYPVHQRFVRSFRYQNDGALSACEQKRSGQYSKSFG